MPGHWNKRFRGSFYDQQLGEVEFFNIENVPVLVRRGQADEESKDSCTL